MSGHRLVLGTAAIGLDRYGLANTTGKPDDKVVESMFQEAADAGVRWLDTAAAYGDAERRVAALGGGHFRICTKLRPDVFGKLGPGQTVAGETARGLETARKVLGQNPDCVLLHNATHALDARVMESFLSTAARWGISLRGVSCYRPDEAVSAMVLGATAIQVPLNLLDLRALRVFPMAERLGVTVFCRSPFLQGALLPGAKFPPALTPAVPRIRHFLDRCIDKGVRPAHAALAGALEAAGTYRVVFGAETLAQVTEDTDFLDSAGAFHAFRGVLGGLDNAVVNPSLWATP